MRAKRQLRNYLNYYTTNNNRSSAISTTTGATTMNSRTTTTAEQQQQQQQRQPQQAALVLPVALPPANASYSILVVVATLIFVLNVNSMCQLGELSAAHNLKMGFQSQNSRPSPPDYFLRAAVTSMMPRLFMPIDYTRKNGTRKDLVKPGDYIYYKQVEYWDSSPVVIESHKLIFFTIPKVGCTVWKQLFRRMMGYEDWTSQDGTKLIPHNPEENGLKYLYDYSTERASEMMTSPEWTRAIMVRDPKERFLSSFLDKSVSNDHHHIISRCCKDGSCVDAAQTVSGFLELCKVCDDEHWRPQHSRMESKYWPYVDMVGHVENAAVDARMLLERIGAWDEYGSTGWGTYGNQSIFASKEVAGAGEHATWAQWQVWKWYNPESEAQVESFFQGDYDNPLFNFTRAVCLTCE